MLGEQARHEIRQAGVEQAAGRQVDGDGHGVAAVQPEPLLGEREVQHPLGQAQDDAGALRDRDELAGRDEPLGRVLPAQQRLETLDPLAVEGDLGLVVQEQLVGALQRPPQVAQHREPDGRGRVHLGLEDDGAALELLRRVHGDVGVPEQLLAVGAVPRGQDDADAGLDVEDHAVDVERLVQGLAQPLGDGLGLADAVHRRQHDGELVATEAADGVRVAQDGPQPRADLAEQLVPVGVAEAVVDLLEPVQVDEQECDLPAGPARRRQALLEAVAAAPSWAGR